MPKLTDIYLQEHQNKKKNIGSGKLNLNEKST